MIRRALTPLFALALLAAACTQGASTTTGGDEGSEDAENVVDTVVQSFAGEDPAPEFPPGLDWLNTGGAEVTLEELKGKVVLLDFWTYGCINCIHIIPDLERLEAEFAEELVVIGVHSAKFTNESATENIRQIILRYDLHHPVVNDRDFETWRQWGANAWPTIALIDPAGNVVGVRSGEGVYDAVAPVIQGLVTEFSDQIDRTVTDWPLERDGLPNTILSFPGNVMVRPDGSEIFIADTNHHRIVRADLPGGEVTAVYGSGRPGFIDDTGLAARFHAPQGMGLSEDGTTLYVADTDNHAVRAIDLASGEVTTVLGTGVQGGYPPPGGLGTDISVRSPWDVLEHGETLYVAMAGSHQLYALDLSTGLAGPFAGNGRESDKDGSATDAELAQPSGLATDGERLFFADSESSSIRVADLATGRVDTVVGPKNGLFTFGDLDGVATEVRLQHPLGVAWDGEQLFIADTYNSKLKIIDPDAQSSTTYVGGDPGWEDGDEPLFYEPGGLAWAEGKLYVADTNNHVIRIVEDGVASTLLLKGIERFQPPPDDEGYMGRSVDLDTIVVAPGAAEVVLDIQLPEGYKVNEDAPSSVAWLSSGDAVVTAPDARDITGTKLPVTFRADLATGSGRLTADVNLVWCANDAESLCFIEQLRIGAPLQVEDGAPSTITLPYEISAPSA